ncbi:MAG: ubiquitin conjugating enzyme [Lasallia pustulata]|uniref:Ubiquitin-conjugating enzyme E2 2 n=1 Tax=Lasallia pustulata TaxID=136370 RepID=A0A5M8PT61_9LECA|nr:MAG: ubiquitin conjugating enzyme [Lasallia pustulata]
MAERILMNEYKTLSQEKWVNVELHEDNVFDWDIALILLNPDSLYYGGYFKAKMSFPKNYPYAPPGFKFVRPLYHPNIYKDGKLCISILHAPGEDEMSGESAAERWSPAQRVESVLLSILSLLDDAEVSSPANVDAGVMLRKQPEEYKRLVKHDVEVSKKDIPAGFVMPTHESTIRQIEKDDDREFWIDSEEDEEFGGSDTDAEMTNDEGDETPDQDSANEDDDEMAEGEEEDGIDR